MPEFVYKVCTRQSWDTACRDGVFAGSADDVRDGYIHLSTATQLRGTLDKHFSGAADLVLITLDAARLSKRLRWEASRGGDEFPHFYDALPVSAAIGTVELLLDENGRHILPADLTAC